MAEAQTVRKKFSTPKHYSKILKGDSTKLLRIIYPVAAKQSKITPTNGIRSFSDNDCVETETNVCISEPRIYCVINGQYITDESSCYNIVPEPIDPEPPQDPYVPEPPHGEQPPPCTRAQTPANRANREVILDSEKREYKPYYKVTPTSHPKSGVTVAVGADLGYITMAELKTWGVSTVGQGQLGRFLGKTGSSAQTEFRKGDIPTISVADETALTNGVFDRTFTALKNVYNNSNTIGINFDELPEVLQTAAVEAAYPLGQYLGLSAPNFWTALKEGRWSDAADELPKGTNGDTFRRLSERAADINKAISNKTIAAQSGQRCK